MINSSRFSLRRSTSFILAACVVWSMAAGAAAQSLDRDRYLCWQLEEVLADLQQHGLRVIYSSDLVEGDMQVTASHRAASPMSVLQEILKPFGLAAEESAAGVVMVVRHRTAGGHSTGSRPLPRRGNAGVEGVLPVWLESSELVEWSFPATASQAPLDAASRYLVVRVATERFEDWQRAAFELKNLILDGRSLAQGVRVALAGDRDALARLVSFGLAPYVDAYAYRDHEPVPAADDTARRWWRVRSAPTEVLSRLLTGAERGDEVVVLEDLRLDDLHHAFLLEIQNTAAGVLYDQPVVEGIAQNRVRFFLDPETDHRYLALYAEGAEQMRFELPQEHAARLLFPRGAAFDFWSSGGHSVLQVDGTSPYYLFELEVQGPGAANFDVEVSDTGIVDPYEEVVKNQVFRERQLNRFESLDVMEYISGLVHLPGADRYQWTHRILQRKGRLTDYHHLAYSINGVPYPEKKLLKGRLFRSEALIQLNPLDVELDETYEYRYLGEETIAGRAAYRIGFRPLREGSPDDGTFVRGEVWLDRRNHAHHRLRTIQKGIDGTFINQDRTYSYEWIASAGQCWWDWTKRRGTLTGVSYGTLYSSETETRRVDFKYNRPDIEQVAQEAYASDIMIHVETPPEGHRWLVKTKDGKRRLEPLAARQDGGTARALPSARSEATGDAAAGEEVSAAGEAATDEDAAGNYGERTLADIHAYSTRTRFSLFGFNSDDEEADLFPGITISDQDFLNRGYQAFVSFFLEDAFVGLSVPRFLRDDWTLSALLFVPYQADERGGSVETPGGLVDTSLEIRQEAFSLSLGMPLGKRTSLNTIYTLRNLTFGEGDSTSERFVLPTDTLEHTWDLALTYRWRNYSTQVGVEYGLRDDWTAWGVDGGEPLNDSYSGVRSSVGGFWRAGESNSLSAAVGHWKGWRLDRISRLSNNLGRGSLTGFGYVEGADEAVVASVGWGSRLWKTPINLRLDQTFRWLEETRRSVGSIRDTRLFFRFLVNGPFRLDIWPSIRLTLDSTDEDEVGDVRYGLSLRRRI
ncbi:MAG: STN domain-containing protein [Acidobacteriota bacterium]